jgi:hypothetical protein
MKKEGCTQYICARCETPADPHGKSDTCALCHHNQFYTVKIVCQCLIIQPTGGLYEDHIRIAHSDCEACFYTDPPQNTEEYE